MSHLIGIVFTLILLFDTQTYAQERGVGLQGSSSEKRVALVIGNSDYQVAPLKNPVNDARDIAQTLAGLGFEVIHRENLNQNDMKRAIREFGAKIRNGGIGLFYYAGHGVAVKGINYLVPIDAKVESEEEVEYECVDAGFVLAQMESAANSLNIVILDACRNNPFARSFRSASRGLAQMDAPTGTLIAYATAPGSVASDGKARNGVYTQELLKNMQTPNLGIEEMFKRVRISIRSLTQGKQTPWESSSLVGDFYFNRANNKIDSGAETAVPAVSANMKALRLDGIWEGAAYQINTNTTWTIKLTARNNTYFIEYPSLSCGGDWTLIDKNLNSARFKEKITYGIGRCVDDGDVIIERISDSQIAYKYIEPNSTVVVASAILKKK